MAEATRVGVVGAGPAGIMAALEAAGAGARVTLFDTNDAVGRKILVTGNGRCNISNLHAAPEHYTCASASFMRTVLERWPPARVLERLEELGILTYATDDGWCYPLSDSAASVAQAFAVALDLAGVTLRLRTRVTDLRPGKEGLTLTLGGPKDTLTVDRVVVATGGKAYPALGSTGEFMGVLERLGHTIVPVRPALAPITADVRRLHRLKGVRLDARLVLYANGEVLGETVGNVMFTEFGLSGPGAMDLSHLVSTHPDANLTLVLDLVPQHRDRLRALLDRRRRERVPLAVVLGAVLPPKVPPVIVQIAGVNPEALLSDLASADLGRVIGLLGHLSMKVTGTRGFRFCQLSTGGVPVTEVDAATMASRRVPGLHLAGEVLDVVAPCGGYNLQYALASGALAGAGAAGV